MNHSTFLLTLVVAAAGTVLSVPAAFAQSKTLSIDAPQAQLNMAQAVVIAESMANGRATRVRLDERAAHPIYRITVQPAGETPLKIDVAAVGGRIVAAQRDEKNR